MKIFEASSVYGVVTMEPKLGLHYLWLSASATIIQIGLGQNSTLIDTSNSCIFFGTVINCIFLNITRKCFVKNAKLIKTGQFFVMNYSTVYGKAIEI